MANVNTQFFKLVSVLFDAAPGKAYYDLLAPVVQNQGLDTVAQVLGSKPQMQTTLGVTAAEQARSLVARVGLDPDNTTAGSADQIAYNWFKSALDNGYNPGQLAMAAIRYLEQDGLSESFQPAAAYLANRAEAARIITLELGISTTNLQELADVIGSVDDDPLSVTQASVSAFDKLRAESTLETYSDLDDEIIGTSAADRIDGGAGYDTIDGGAGADILMGGSGDDVVKGGKGQDLIEGGDGADTLYAGSFYDYEYISGGYNSAGEYVAGYRLYDVNAWYEIIRGGGGSDTIYGGYGSDYLEGGDGADTLYGEENSIYFYSNAKVSSDQIARMYNDTLLGGGGNDRLFGEKGSDHIEGGEGADTIYGGEGNDTLHGDAGDDTIRGGEGADHIYGGEGNDNIDAGDWDEAEDVVEGGAGDDYIGGLEMNDSADGGDGNDTISYSRGDNRSSSVLIAGEGADEINIYNNYEDRITDRVIVDLTETVQSRDKLSLSIHDRTSSLVEVKGFDIDTDVMSFSGSLDTYRPSQSEDYDRWVDNMQTFAWSGDLTRNYVQIVDSATTPWLTRSATQETPDDYGKAYFVIQGATANSASTTDVAALLDAYGNNASYANSAEHVFLVNIKDVGVGVYKFEDDTGADNRVVSDELTPLVALVGVSTEEINYANASFII